MKETSPIEPPSDVMVDELLRPRQKLDVKAWRGWLLARRLWLLAFAAIFATRLALILWPPSGGLYNVDEAEMVSSTIDRFLGVPSTSLAWPGTILQLLVLPFVGLQLGGHCAAVGGIKNLECIASGVGHLYLAPSPTLTVMRVVSALLASAAPLLVFRISRRLNVARTQGLLAAATLAFAPLFWQHGAMATGDGASITLALGALVAALSVRERGSRAALLSGGLMGAGLAAKFTSLNLGLLSGVAIALMPRIELPRRVGLLSAWGGGIIAAFMALCPYVWIDPIRLLKSAVGNLLRPGPSGGLPQVWSLLAEAAGAILVPVSLLALVGVFSLFRARDRRWFGWISVIGLVLLLAPLARNSAAYGRYALPALALLTVLTGVGADQLLRALSRVRANPRMDLAVSLVLFAIPAFAFVRASAAEIAGRAPSPFVRGLATISARLPAGDLYLPSGSFFQALPRLSRQTCDRMAQLGQQHAANADGAAQFMAKRGIGPGAALALITDFDEDERALLARLRAMRMAAPASGIDAHFFFDGDGDGQDVLERIAYIDHSRTSAIAAFRGSSRPSALLIDCKVDGLAASEELAGWFLYIRN
jgi:hypothetical protein